MRPMIAVALAAATVAALAAASAASIVLRVSPREMADTSNLVVEGRVSAVDVRWDGARACINTYVTVAVDRLHKGTAAGSVVVKVPGGRVGEDEVRVEGTAKFAVDEEVLVFLWKDGQGEWIVLGEAQGKFLLRRDEKAGTRTAENSLSGLCLVVRNDPLDPAKGVAARKPDRLAYDDLVAVVKASVEAAAGKAPGPGPAPVKTPDPPAPTTAPDGGAPPPAKDAPAPPAGDPGTGKGGQMPPPSPDDDQR